MSNESGDAKTSTGPRLVAIEGDAAHKPDPDLPAGENDEAVQLKIRELEQEHRDLDQAIITLEERMPYDRLALQRMKKRKLKLKDEIVVLKDRVNPDIIA